jgi:hypothetical protein
MLNSADLKKKAKKLSIQAGNMSKTQLIRAIQTTEGNFPCFKTAADDKCDQHGCAWREDCLSGK